MHSFFRFSTLWLLLGSLLGLSACQSEPAKPSAIVGLATPISLQQRITRVVLEDYFNDVKQIDSVRTPQGFAGSMTADRKVFVLEAGSDTLPALAEMGVKAAGTWYSLVLRRPNVGVDEGLLPQLSTQSFVDKTVRIRTKNNPNQVVALWENQLLPVAFVEDGLEIVIPEQAARLGRSHLRVWSANGAGLSNDLLIPLQDGHVVTDASRLDRQDLHTSTLYFVLVDRFVDGNKANTQRVNDPRVLDKANYYGGDLEGILQKLKAGYFKEMGFNTLWVSPITQNPLGAYQEFPEPRRWFSGYHGYWPISLRQIDTRFGSDAVLHEIVKEAHAQGINVLLDYVANHLHAEHPMFKQRPNWFTKIDLPDGRKNIRLWDEQRLTTWFEPFMPDIDYTQNEVVEAMSDSAVYWIKKFDLDGFRHDATKHVPEQFWRRLTQKLKQEVMVPQQKKLYQIGETFGSRELIGSYISSGMQDAQFDFNLYFDAREVFGKDSEGFVRMKKSLQESLYQYGSHHLMGNITGNHDLPRFISLASGALDWNEDPKEAGWKRKISNEKPEGYEKLTMLETFLTTVPGLPVVYQGDEIGQAGANDPDNRRWMKFDSLTPEEVNVKKALTKNLGLRRKSMALQYGDFELIKADDKTMYFVKSYFGDFAVVAFNKDSKKRTISIPMPEHLVTKVGKTLNIQLLGYSYVVATPQN
jgi:cyclomaltodextrinase / maltogenic alpha-amylase / neopullulanase